MKNLESIAILVLCASLGIVRTASAESEPERFISDPSVEQAVLVLTQEHGEEYEVRIRTGVNQVASLWWEENGSQEEFVEFCQTHFIAKEDRWAEALQKTDQNIEILQGHFHQIDRALNSPYRLNLGEPDPEDRLFADAVPQIDFYDSQIAFFIALNFPHYSLDEKLSLGPQWTRQEWASARLGDMFTSRITPEIESQARSFTQNNGDYFQNYMIRMDHVLTLGKSILFPEGLELGCHHGLRDNLKGQYTIEDGQGRQQMIYAVMLRIIDQTIPTQMIGNTDLFWQPETNDLFKKQDGQYVPLDADPEDNRRYEVLLNAFQSQRVKDPCYPSAPTYIERTFDNRQMSEETIESIILSVLDSPEAAQVGELISQRLGRPLQPFDIWYNGFQAQSGWSENELDELTKERYPTPAAFDADIPTLLDRLGFPEDQARFLSDHTVVDPVRIGGHADGAARRGDNSHLRTVFTSEGLDYKGFRIGMHELGHTTHQNLARYGSDYYILGNLPMSGFAEAIAELFAYRNMKALGLEDQTDPHEREMQALASFWYVYEHGGQALTEMRTWRWLYAHPDADADQLKAAAREIARSVWNEFYAPVFGVKDVEILSIYSHFINGSLYLNSYVLGNIIMYQLYDYMEGEDFAAELDRICRQGRLTPDLWMEQAVGSPVSTEPLLRDVRSATSEFLRD